MRAIYAALSFTRQIELMAVAKGCFGGLLNPSWAVSCERISFV